jgi:hypothetical protein
LTTLFLSTALILQILDDPFACCFVLQTQRGIDAE